jgi:putative SOS response-associated peptidase YedK
MCYYNGVKVSRTEYIRLKALEKAIANYDFLSKPLHIGFDYSGIPVLKRFADKEDFDILEMEWGFLPNYLRTREQANNFRFGYKKENGQFQPPITTLNAMGEELLLSKKMYRDAALNRRCLILSTGFYEWRHVYPLNKKTGLPLKTANKYPYSIGVKNADYFFMAGIYNPWKDVETGEFVETCSIVTTEANEIMAQIHNSKKRMPTILTEDLAWEWMFGDLTEKRITEIATFQFPAKDMDGCTIRKDFREAYDPTEKFEYEGLQPIDLEFAN